ncbi:MAG: carotenoid 1,2-hydratase [Verrucomicrobiota bacterium]|nr:carotenoid 1,2-hydratase [Verrucomicrobiota bacterium]
MKRLLLFCLVGVSVATAAWRVAEPGWAYEFPRDHHSHPGFKTEWWYFTGNLADDSGRRFGYQLTFFRQGIRPLEERDPTMSRFVVSDLKFAHFTVTDAAGQRFEFAQKNSRGTFGEAGFDDGERLAWIESWTLQMDAEGRFTLHADSANMAIELRLETKKPPAIHGADGVSTKAAGEGHASHYYSLTRLATEGTIRIGGKDLHVLGESWFDHEWATSQLAPDQVGWDWLSVAFDDGTELMLYQMRLENGAADPASSGTWIAVDGTTTHLPKSAFKMTPTRWWKSGKTSANYPIEWRIEIPDRALQIQVRPVLANQELALMPLAYWEGAVEVTGTQAGHDIKGRGYLELTGYAGPLRELQR